MKVVCCAAGPSDLGGWILVLRNDTLAWWTDAVHAANIVLNVEV